MDLHTADGRVWGLAISHSEGDADYWGPASGRLETDLKAVHPYFRATLGGGMQVWAMAGVGRGDAHHRLADQQVEKSDLDLYMGAVGVRREWSAFDDMTLAFRGDASISWLETDGGTKLVDDLTAKVHRVRAGLEFSGAAQAGRVPPFGAVSARYDGSDGIEGAGLDVEGGMRYADANGRVRIEARGRWLAAHSENGYEQWGAGVSVQVLPEADGRGLSLRLEPRLGTPVEGDSPLWGQASLEQAEGLLSSRGLSLDAELGWGAWSPSLGGVLIGFGEVRQTEALASQIRLGLRFVRGRTESQRLTVELFGEQGTRWGSDDHRVGASLQLNY